MRPYSKHSMGSLRIAAAALFALVVSSCQTEPTKPVEDGTYSVSIPTINGEHRQPDLVTWKIGSDTGSAVVEGGESSFQIKLQGKVEGDVRLDLWRSGVRIMQLKYARKTETMLEYVSKESEDALVSTVFQQILPSKDSIAFAKKLAELVVGSDSVNRALEQAAAKVVGVNHDTLMARAMQIMVESGKTIGEFLTQEDGTFLGQSLESIHVQVKILVDLKIIVADTNALFPPPPVRIISNLSMPEQLQAGGDAAGVSGKFEATGKIATLLAKVYQDTLDVSRHFEIPQVDLTSRPKELDLDGKLSVTAKASAAAGTYRLEVVVMDADEDPNSIKAVVGFQVLPVADTNGPVIQIMSPVDGTVFAYDAQSVLVKVAATDPSGIDSVKIDGKPAESVGTEYAYSMALEPGKEAVIRVQAWDKLKNSSIESLTVTRKGPPDITAPRLKLLGPASGAELSIDTKTAILRWLVTDLFGLDDAELKIDGKVAKRSADTVSLEVAAPAPGSEESHRIDVKNTKGVSNFETMTLKRAKDVTIPKLVRVDSGRKVPFETEKVTVSWKVTDDYKLGTVTIAGKAVTGGDGLFAQEMALVPGDNQVVIVATDTFGNVSRDSVVVIRSFSTKKLAWLDVKDVQGVEDSIVKFEVMLDGIRGGKAKISVVPTGLVRDTTFEIVGGEQAKIRANLVPSVDANGTAKIGLVAVSGADTARSEFSLSIVARNDPPRFEIVKSIPAINAGVKTQIEGWIANLSAGPQDESAQKLAFEVAALEAADLLVGIPSVGNDGTLAFQAKAGVSGLARFQVRLHDNGDSSTGNANASAWQTFSVRVNSAPSVTLPLATFSMVQNTSASPGSMTISDEETSVGNLVVVRSSSNSSLIPPESVMVAGTGASRKLTLRPVRDRSGSAVLTFTVRDSLGAETSESMTIEVKSVNKAPSFSLSVASLVLQNYNQDSLFAKFVLNESTNDTLQYIKERKVELIGAPFESVLVAKPILDGSGTLHLPRIPNPRGAFLFRITIRDNGGVENGGIDSATKDLRIFFSDTIIDPFDRNVYKYVQLGKRTWFAENLRRAHPYPIDPNQPGYYEGSFGKRYSWAMAMNLDSADCDGGVNCAERLDTQHQGLCPVGWNIPDSIEWMRLREWAVTGRSDSLGIEMLKSKSDWSTIFGMGSIFLANGTDAWGMDLKPNYPVSGNALSARYWAKTFASGDTYHLDRKFVDVYSSGGNSNSRVDNSMSVYGIHYARYGYGEVFPIRCVKSLPPGQW